jgi:hypothetical protein
MSSPIFMPVIPQAGSAYPIELVTVDPVSGSNGPTGPSPQNWFQYNVINGKLWACVNGVWAQINSSSGASGSAALDFGTIADGGYGALTFTLTGAVVGNYLAPLWPTTLPAGLVGTMLVTATNTVTVTLANLSGAPITTGSLTYGAKVI